MPTFTAFIAREIESRYPNGEPFTKSDLVSISNQFGKNEKAITHVLRDMHERGGLRIVGELKTRSGCTKPSKVYARIPSAKLVAEASYRKKREDYKREVNEKEAKLNRCGVRLHEVVMVGWDRARAGYER